MSATRTNAGYSDATSWPSRSILGIVPPTIDNGELLVDGGVLNNLPTDLMRDTGAGTVIAVDVSPERDFSVSTDVGLLPRRARLCRREGARRRRVSNISGSCSAPQG